MTTHQQAKHDTLADRLSGRDRVGIAGDVLITAGGLAAGAAAAGTVAATAGVSTIAGSTVLGSVLGGVFVAATPVGWVFGTAVVGGAIAYGVSRLVRSGAIQDERRRRLRDLITGHDA
jgi:hypothetical protein